MTWDGFAAEAPELAAEGRERMDRTGLILLGTLRSDGFPRISPVEPIVHDGELYLGMIHRSTKAQDLHRDPRCVVHTVVTDKDGTDGEFKVYGRARSVEGADERAGYVEALRAAIDWAPEGPFDLFAIAVEQVALVVFGDGHQRVQVWRPGQPVRTTVTESPG